MDTDLVKALGPYKIVEKTNFLLKLKYSRSLHINIYIYTIMWIGIAIYLQYSEVPWSTILVVSFVLAYIAFCFLFRYIAIKNAFFVIAEKGQIKLKYKKFFNGERDVSYNAQDLRGIEPFYVAVKQTMVTSIRIHLVNGTEEQLFFASGEKPLAKQRSEMIASLFSQVTGIQLLK
jgi:hypothetical protein